jgi:hypothetical protein
MTGYALDSNSNTVAGSLALTFSGTPLEFAPQAAPVLTLLTNVAQISSDGTLDATGNLLWFTNLTDFLVVPPEPPQTNILSAATFTNLLAPDGTLIPLSVVTTNYATNVVAGAPGTNSYSFTNDWAVLQSTLRGVIKAGKRTVSVRDTAATLVQPHLTNWLGLPLVVSNTYYGTVYSLLVDGSLSLNVLDSFSANVVQSGRSLFASATNFSGKGTVSVNARRNLSTSRVAFTGLGSARGENLRLVATNGTLITAYKVNSNAPPMVVTFTNSIGVPPIFSVSNSVSGILLVDDVINYVTNGAYVIESHYGPAALTNPAYITNTVAGAIKTLTLSGKLKGQAFSGASGVNLDAQYQLLPVGTEPAGSGLGGP